MNRMKRVQVTVIILNYQSSVKMIWIRMRILISIIIEETMVKRLVNEIIEFRLKSKLNWDFIFD